MCAGTNSGLSVVGKVDELVAGTGAIWPPEAERDNDASAEASWVATVVGAEAVKACKVNIKVDVSTVDVVGADCVNEANGGADAAGTGGPVVVRVHVDDGRTVKDDKAPRPPVVAATTVGLAEVFDAALAEVVELTVVVVVGEDVVVLEAVV